MSKLQIAGFIVSLIVLYLIAYDVIQNKKERDQRAKDAKCSCKDSAGRTFDPITGTYEHTPDGGGDYTLS